MNFLTKLLNFYLYSSLHISIAAAFLAINSFIIFGGKIDWNYVYFVFSATLLLYSLHRIIGINSMSSFKDIGRFKIINKYKSHIILYSILALLFSNYTFFQFELNLKLLLIVPSIISLAYVLPLFKNKKRLRDFDNIKIFLIAFSWAYVSVVIPGVLSEEINISLILIKSLEIVAFIFAITLPFDIRDLNYDQSNEVQTLPTKLGLAKTFKLSKVALGTSILLLLVLLSLNLIPLSLCIIQIVFYIILIFSIEHFDDKKSDYYFTGILDATIIIYAIPSILMNILI